MSEARKAASADDAFDDVTAYVSKPTGRTLFWRTFIPWQAWRFAIINLKMIRIIGKGHASGRKSARPSH